MNVYKKLVSRVVRSTRDVLWDNIALEVKMSLFGANIKYPIEGLCTRFSAGHSLVHQEMIDKASFFVVQELLLSSCLDARS